MVYGSILDPTAIIFRAVLVHPQMFWTTSWLRYTPLLSLQSFKQLGVSLFDVHRISVLV